MASNIGNEKNIDTYQIMHLEKAVATVSLQIFFRSNLCPTISIWKKQSIRT